MSERTWGEFGIRVGRPQNWRVFHVFVNSQRSDGVMFGWDVYIKPDAEANTVIGDLVHLFHTIETYRNCACVVDVPCALHKDTPNIRARVQYE